MLPCNLQYRDNSQLNWVQRLAAIAEWLTREALRRQNRAKRNDGWYQVLERDGEVQIHRLEPDGNPSGKRLAEIATYPRKPWVLITFFKEAPPSEKPDRFRVIVYFRYHKKHEAIHKRLMREDLRKARMGKAMVIDTKTSTREITEQLAIYLSQEGILDESTQALLGLRSRSDVTSQVASRLWEKFVDPMRPQSYRAYKNVIRRAVHLGCLLQRSPADSRKLGAGLALLSLGATFHPCCGA